MSEFISADHVFLNRPDSSREEVLESISKHARDLDITDDAEATFKAFMWREEQCETGMEDGFAIPHAKSPAIKHASVIVYRTDKSLEWPSFDGKPVDISIALLVPEVESGSTHIKLLSKTAVLLMDDDFRKFVRSSSDPIAISERVAEGVNDIDEELDYDEDDE